MSTSSASSLGAWGDLRPGRFGQALHLLVAAGAGRGTAKKLLEHIWRRRCGDQPVDVVVRGVKYRLDFRDNTPARKVLFGSLYDARELKYLRQANRSGGVFVDIGANIGYYTLDLASHGARVIAIEPNPIAYARLQFNIEANDLDETVAALPYCVAEPGQHKLTFRGSLGTGSLIALHGEGTEVMVKGETLLNILTEQRVDRVASLKIDIEGTEDRALVPFFETAPQSLWPRCAVVEHSNRSVWKTDLLELMIDSGYEVICRKRANTILRRRS